MSEVLCAAILTLGAVWAAWRIAARVLPPRRLRRSLARFPDVFAGTGLAHVTDQTPFAAVDLLYSVVVFELGEGRLSVSIPAHAGWWSLQVIAISSDNVAYRSGKGDEGEKQFVLKRQGDARAVPPGHDVVEAPARGVLVLRYLVRDPALRTRVEQLRRAAALTHL